ncbi:MAG TPA: helix-turn-helix domain-containing protein [Amaricoccus sp.]|uniref:helix-turn-helix domain-containing protein n=1 Tax=Amaricoccus sp. TaxID=1872485 RepID=UPI002BB982E6|nr:helix-turn-helix domain-containing protein [Amaricoccus sp.]HMQ94939.1 helix-turn-helix domain-containing protein [Amaricoccus sp.]HMR53768.1 helix-turn-helix domain-containing protein [Amaricoccus sp.]HMR61107.1 helix-turn-helix domain-containing protein [Amaricoccus sp.]HMU00524.1 helix-turn-helix domain-containing protein [Amaricoccus sp.]
MSEHDFRLGDELRGERATLGKSLLDVHRDLRIKASYISAIEDMDLSVFPNPSFVPGYVRAYARYLQLDPDMVYRRFCRESGFARPKDLALQPRAGAAAPAEAGSFQTRFPLAEVGSGIPSIPFSAIGSVLVLLVLVAALGYGGWTVLQNIQRVQFAPVDDLPLALSEVEPLEAPEVAEAGEVVLTELAEPVASTALAELYRQQEIEVPILQPRDGPIAALDPDRLTPLAARRAEVVVVGPPVAARADAADPAVVLAAVESSLAGEPAAEPAIVADAADLPLVVVAERAAWVRVYLESGTIIFEKILEKGETYTPPAGVGAPRIWAGNAGSVYVRVGDRLHGPLGSGTRAVRDVVLSSQAVAERFAEVAVVPEVISQAIGAGQPALAAPIEIQ